MRVLRLSNFDLGRLRSEWDGLARGVPLRGWTWLTTWWSHHGASLGASAELFTLGVFDDAGRLVGLAPWYLNHSPLDGRVLRPLTADDDLHGEDLSLLCAPEVEEQVLDALADWLSPTEPDQPTETDPADAFSLREVHKTSGRDNPTPDDLEEDADDDFDPWSSAYWSEDAVSSDRETNAWDMIVLCDACQDDLTSRLARRLAERGATPESGEPVTSWRIALPSTIDAYLDALSPKRADHLRRLTQRWIDSGDVTLRRVETLGDLEAGLAVLRRLEDQRTWEPWEDDSARPQGLTPFHSDATTGLLHDGHLLLAWIECDGRPLCLKYMLSAGSHIFTCQSLFDPRVTRPTPEHLAQWMVLRWAIENGFSSVDLFRGGPRDRIFWGAQPRHRARIRITAPRQTVHAGHALRGRYSARHASRAPLTDLPSER